MMFFFKKKFFFKVKNSSRNLKKKKQPTDNSGISLHSLSHSDASFLNSVTEDRLDFFIWPEDKKWLRTMPDSQRPDVYTNPNGYIAVAIYIALYKPMEGFDQNSYF